MNIINGIIGLAFKYIIVIAIVTIALFGYSNLVVNDVRDGEVELQGNIIAEKFTPSYIGSAAYWKDRDLWYTYGCLKNRDHCGDNTRFTHVEYINARYFNYYERVEHLNDPDRSSFWDFFSVR